MNSNDFVLPFMLENGLAQGRVESLEKSITQILSQHEYPDIISQNLSELILITTFLGQNLKSEGVITSQIQSKDGIVKLLVAEYTYPGMIRGYASFDQNVNLENIEFSKIFADAQLVVTHESGESKYQGIIAINSESISSSFSSYIENSEQIKSVVKNALVSTNIFDDKKYKASGIMLKKMPSDHDEDEWNRLEHFMNSISSEELLNTEAEELLQRLFHADGVLVFEKNDILFKCKCSREKMENALSAIPEDEKESLKIDGKISIKCQFCSREEFFV